jgi:hypothetical protein
MKKEVMIFVRGKWEFAKEEDSQWVRRDTSFICYVGEETAKMSVPPKPIVK